MKPEIEKTTVVFDGLVKTEPELKEIFFHKSARRSDGREKIVRATAIVKDDALLKKLEKLKVPTNVEIEIYTDWEDAEIPTVLINFREIKTRRANGFDRSNGKPALKQNEISEEKELVIA